MATPIGLNNADALLVQHMATAIQAEEGNTLEHWIAVVTNALQAARSAEKPKEFEVIVFGRRPEDSDPRANPTFTVQLYYKHRRPGYYITREVTSAEDIELLTEIIGIGEMLSIRAQIEWPLGVGISNNGNPIDLSTEEYQALMAI